jgi:hypothetical protein
VAIWRNRSQITLAVTVSFLGIIAESMARAFNHKASLGGNVDSTFSLAIGGSNRGNWRLSSYPRPAIRGF